MKKRPEDSGSCLLPRATQNNKPKQKYIITINETKWRARDLEVAGLEHFGDAEEEEKHRHHHRGRVDGRRACVRVLQSVLQ